MRTTRQSGAALLILLVILALGALFWVTQNAAQFNAEANRNKMTDQALMEAKAALLGYATAYPEYHLRGNPARAAFVPGYLPCPDTGSPLGSEGTEAGNCGAKGISAIGHFPWRSLGIPPPRDGSGECLWYAVSGNYKANPKADLLNPDIPGQFQIVNAKGEILIGDTPENRPVAVLFAAGAPRAGQYRGQREGECSLNFEAKQFLESLNGVDNSAMNDAPEGLTRLVVDIPSETFNDRLAWISREELFDRYVTRHPQSEKALFDENSGSASPALSQRIAACIARFGEHNPQNRLPWAVPLALSANAPDTFMNEKFADQANRRMGRPPFSVGRSQQVLSSTLGTLPACPASNLSHSSCRLLRSDHCPEILPVAGYPTPDDGTGNVGSPNGWWDKWKDHLFYAVAQGFAPSQEKAVDCDLDPDKCLMVNGRPYAAALIFSGEPLSGQKRGSLSERTLISNYLEGQNAESFLREEGPLGIAGNDQISCIVGPTAASPGFKIVPNCGNLDCKVEARQLLSHTSGVQNTCGQVSSNCAAVRGRLVGCACLGSADIFLSEPCLKSLSSPLCQKAVLGLKTCA